MDYSEYEERQREERLRQREADWQRYWSETRAEPEESHSAVSDTIKTNIDLQKINEDQQFKEKCIYFGLGAVFLILFFWGG